MATQKQAKSSQSGKSICTICEKSKPLNKLNFWQSESIVNSNGYLHICSDCINDMFSNFYKDKRGFGEDYELNGENIVFDEITEDIVKDVCRYIDLSFNYDAYHSWVNHVIKNREEEGSRKINKVFGIYKSKLSTTAKQNGISGITYDYSDETETTNNSESTHKVPKKNLTEEMTELKEKWGLDYDDSQVMRFENKYNFLQNNYKAKTNMHIEALLKYVRYTVLAEMATEADDEKKAKVWEELAQKAATAAKINPSQLSKADLSEGLNTIAELVQAVEREIDIIPILPSFKYRPNDALDFNIWCYVNYERHLRGMPLCSYEDVYKFYDERKEDYIEQYGDPYGIFTGDTTLKNRENIKNFIKVDKIEDGGE